MVAIGLFTLLDYRFHQDPHRIVKLLLGLAGMGTIIAQPQIGLLLLPLATPFLGWMPRLPIPGVNALNLLLLAVFGAWAVGRVMRREDVFRPSRLGAIIVVMLGLAALSIVRGGAFPTGYTYSVGEAVYTLVRSAMTFGVYFIGLAMVRGEKMRRRVAWAIVLALLAEAAVTAVYGRNGRGQRAIGSFGQSNELGAFLAMFTAFAVAMIPGTRRWFGRLVLLATAALGALAVLMSLSRGAMVALAAAVLYVGLRSSRLLTLSRPRARTTNRTSRARHSCASTPGMQSSPWLASIRSMASVSPGSRTCCRRPAKSWASRSKTRRTTPICDSSARWVCSAWRCSSRCW